MKKLTKIDTNGAEATILQRLDTKQKRISETKRLLTLVLGLFCMICTSFGSYTFNLVSDQFQTRYNLSQRDMTAITTCGSVVGNVVLPYSFVYDFFGPLPIAILCIIVFPLGALLTAFCFEKIITGDVVKLCVFYSFMNLGTTFFDLVCCMTVISYFPTRRGAVVALLKTFVGLGSAITGSLYLGYFGGAIEAFFYFLMVFAAVAGILCAFFMKMPSYMLTGWEERRLSPEEKAKRRATKAPFLTQQPKMYHFYYGFVILLILVIYLPITSALSSYMSFSTAQLRAFAIVTTVLTVCFVFIAFPFHRIFCPGKYPSPSSKEGSEEEQQREEESETKDDGLQVVTVAEHFDGAAVEPEQDLAPRQAELEYAMEEAEKTEIDYIAPQYQTSFWRNLLSPHLWCLVWTQFVVLGAEIMMMDNATYIFQSLSGEEVSRELRVLLTVLNGVGSAVGRLIMSGFEAYTQSRPAEKRIPITLCLFFPSASVIITLVLMLVLPKAALPLPYVIGALGNGFLSAAALLVTRTIYARDVAKHYNFLFLADAFSAIVFNRFLYGEWYTQQAEKHNEKVCYRRVCVQMPLIVCIGLSCTAFITDVIAHFRYRSFCKKVLAERAARREGREMTEEGGDGEEAVAGDEPTKAYDDGYVEESAALDDGFSPRDKDSKASK